MNTTIVSGVITFVLGITVTWIALALPAASVGMPHAPKVFPAGIGILIVVLSLVQLVKEFYRVRKERETFIKRGGDPYLKLVLLTCAAALGYAVVFKRIGYVPATFLFLEAELWLFNGRHNWKINTMVAIFFSVGIYLLFAKAFGVYLPRIPYLWI